MLRRSLVVLLGLAMVSPACTLDTTGSGDEDTDTDTESEDEDDDSDTETEDDGSGENDETGETDPDDGGSGDSASGDVGSDDTGDTDTGDTGSGGTGTGDTGSDDTGSDDTGTGDTGTDDTGTGDTGTDDTGDDDTDECSIDDDCEGDAPYCEAGECVGCDGLATSTCADKDPERPVCRDSGGPCVECTTEQDELCEAKGLVCGDDNTCRNCQEHAECEVACDLDDGVCVDATPLHVDNVGCVGGKELGTEEDPFCTVGDGVAAIAGVGPGVAIVHAGNPYVEHVEVNGEKVVVILGDESPELRASSQSVFSVETGGKVYGWGLTVGGGSSSGGVDCIDGSVWLDDSEVTGTSGDGIRGQDCDLHLRRTELSESGTNGIRLDGGALTLGEVTVSGSGENGIHVIDGGTLELVGVTLSQSDENGLNVVNGGDLSLTDVTVSNSGDDGVGLVNGGTLNVTDMTVSESGRVGIDLANGGTLALDGAIVSGSGDVGLSANGGEIQALRTQVLGNDGGGITLDGGAILEMTTSIIGGNGGNGASDTVGLLADGSSFELVYVTIANNLGSEPHRSVACQNMDPKVVPTIRNSIVVAQQVDSVACAALTVTTSVVQDPDIATDNADVGLWNEGWFVDPGEDDYHLGKVGGDFEDVARWLTDDPAADIDGEARPTANDTADWPGADVP